MNFDTIEFRNAMGNFMTGVTLITVGSEGDDFHVMTANSFSSVSLEPPIISVCVDYRAKMLEKISEEGYFGVNFLQEEQINLSKYFAKQYLEENPNFEFNKDEDNVPLLEDALTSLKCKVVKEVVVGDHTVFFGEVEKFVVNEGLPLCFFKGKYRGIGELV